MNNCIFCNSSHGGAEVVRTETVILDGTEVTATLKFSTPDGPICNRCAMQAAPKAYEKWTEEIMELDTNIQQLSGGRIEGWH